MKLPALSDPQKYTGLYIFDFGDHISVGYTAAEITMLLDQERLRNGQVYRIHRGLPDGTLELQGVSRGTFVSEDGLFFYRDRIEDARADYELLIRRGGETPLPCRVKVQLADASGTGGGPLTAMIFPAESTGEVSRWLQEIDFQGGDRVDGGSRLVSEYYAHPPQVLERRELWPEPGKSRSLGEVLATTHLDVQR